MHLLHIYLVSCCFNVCLAQLSQWQNRRSFRPGVFRGCELPKLKNGVVRLRQRGRLAMFSCRLPFLLHGDRYASCISGRWDVPSPTCIKSGCQSVPTPENGVVYPQQNHAVLTMFCNSGYQRVGSAQAFCDGNNWDRPLGICREISTAVQTNCDFEVDDLCGWTQDANHDFDWKRTNGVNFGKVITIGPKHDHTIKRQFEGYYMLLDMKDEEVGTKARLISPTFNASQSENACFRLYYHMFGLSPGKLRVYSKPLSVEILDVVVNDGYKFFETVGNQGNIWKEGYFHLPIFKEDFQIIIEGTSTRSYDSHIAIDDLALLNGDDCDPGSTTNDDDVEEQDGIIGTQTCESRCDEQETTLQSNVTEFVTENGQKVKKCDCFYGCEDINSCCTNFRAICAQVQLSTPEEEIVTGPVITTITSTKSSTTTTTNPKTSTTKTTRKVTTTPQAKKTSTTSSSSSSTTTPRTTTSKTTITTTTNTKPIDDIAPLDVTPYEEDYSDEDIVHLPPGHHHASVDFNNQSTNTHFISYTILSGLLISIGLIGITGGIKYYRRQKFDPRNYKQNPNGVQQAGDEFSEVRFLTTDEQLDFSLQDPSSSDR